MKKFTVAQLQAKLASKAPRASEEETKELAVEWANSVAKFSDPHARITAKLQEAAATGYIHEGRRYYMSHVAAMAHKLFD